LALTGWDKRVVKPSEVAEDIDPNFTSRNSLETFSRRHSTSSQGLTISSLALGLVGLGFVNRMNTWTAHPISHYSSKRTLK
jgi:hypothetical protein